MSKIDFGELDYIGRVPANDLKEKIQTIAFCHIQEMLTEFAFDEKGALAFMSEVDGVIGMVEAIGETIDEEVKYYNSEMEQLKANAEQLKENVEQFKAKAGDTYAGNP